MLILDRICVEIGGAEVVKNISLTISEGESLGIVGPNGAGKTSLARAIIGLCKFSAGSMSLRTANPDPSWENLYGLPVWAMARKGIVYVPEERGVFEALSVYDNLAVAFSAMRISKKDATILLSEAYSYFPFLRERSRQRAGTLSGGERKMLSIARAVLFSLASKANVDSGRRFDLLILDEPTHGLHPRVKDEIKVIICKIRSLGWSMLILEQDYEFAVDVADECWLMERGQLRSKLRK
jgi:branched-chain amino acid transport system ATP-binding protein